MPTSAGTYTQVPKTYSQTAPVSSLWLRLENQTSADEATKNIKRLFSLATDSRRTNEKRIDYKFITIFTTKGSKSLRIPINHMYKRENRDGVRNAQDDSNPTPGPGTGCRTGSGLGGRLAGLVDRMGNSCIKLEGLLDELPDRVPVFDGRDEGRAGQGCSDRVSEKNRS